MLCKKPSLDIDLHCRPVNYEFKCEQHRQLLNFVVEYGYLMEPFVQVPLLGTLCRLFFLTRFPHAKDQFCFV